jgi:hypothetical protein
MVEPEGWFCEELADILAELFTVKKDYLAEGVVVLLDGDKEEEQCGGCWGGVTRTVKSGVRRSGCIERVPGRTANSNYTDEAEILLARLMVWEKRVKL